MKARLLIILGVLTVIRWIYCGVNELSPDEAYYYMWSQHPDLSYYSKGPGVAMTILVATKIFGATEFGVRAFSPLLALGTSLLLFAMARRLYDERTAFWSTILIQCVPIFNVGGIVMTIDPLSIFFWTLAAWWFWLAMEKSPNFSKYWPLTGVALALGLLCKYTNLAALVSIAALLCAVPAWRVEWRRPGFYSMLATTCLGLIPPVLWNMNHEWITLAHLKERGGLDSEFSMHLDEPFKYLLMHFGVYSPLIFAGLIWSLAIGLGRIRQSRKTAFLVIFTLPLLLLYFGLAMKEAGEPNWTAPAMITLAIYGTHDWLRRMNRTTWAGMYVGASLIVGVVITVVILNAEPLRALGVRWSYNYDAGARLTGWKQSAEVVQEVRNEVEQKTGSKVFLIGNKYQVAASLAWYLPDKTPARPGHPPVYIPESQMLQNQFSFWPSYDTFEDAPAAEKDPYNTEEDGVNYLTGHNALYVTDREEGKPASALMRGFAHWEYWGERAVVRHGLVLRKLRFFVCYDYQTLPL